MAAAAPLGQEAEWSSFRVGGTRVDAPSIADAIDSVRHWVKSRAKRRIAFCTASTVVGTAADPDLAEALEDTDLVTPDGMPLVWLGRRRTGADVERVYGPDFMIDLLQETGGELKHFFFGGAPGVAEAMAVRLRERFGAIKIAGTFAPDEISGTELNSEHVKRINDAGADIVWVGLGHPKQELWMKTYRPLLDAPVLAGVGAAFDFLSGRKKEAPAWVKRSGLQWLHRLLSEPRRLWRRYLVGNTKFLKLVLADEIAQRGVHHAG